MACILAAARGEAIPAEASAPLKEETLEGEEVVVDANREWCILPRRLKAPLATTKALAGLYGMLIAIPVAACIKILLREVVMPRVRDWVAGKVDDPLPIEE